jgi:hypothetical protein
VLLFRESVRRSSKLHEKRPSLRAIVQSSSSKGVQSREGVPVDRVGASTKASMAKTARFW